MPKWYFRMKLMGHPTKYKGIKGWIHIFKKHFSRGNYRKGNACQLFQELAWKKIKKINKFFN